MDSFTKQPWEEFPISGDFGKNMESGETIIAQTATAVDAEGNDATNDVLDPIVQSNGTLVIVGCKAGDESLSPYKITFRATTSAGNKWELDVKMKIKEI